MKKNIKSAISEAHVTDSNTKADVSIYMYGYNLLSEDNSLII